MTTYGLALAKRPAGPCAPLRGISSALGHRGQVLVWFLGFTAVLAVVFAGVYSVGQVTSEKQKTVNAADAAAYSGALVEARSLNMVAYTNRAVIANEVLIAQAISLQSWTDYFERATQKYQGTFRLLTGVPFLGAAFAALSATMQALNTVFKSVQTPLQHAVVRGIAHWEGIYKAWFEGAIHSAFSPPNMALAAKAAAEDVLRQNVATQGGRKDSPAQLVETPALMAANEWAWRRATRWYSGNDRRHAKQLLLASRDDFSTRRPGSEMPFFKLLFGNSSLCMPHLLKIESDKRGVTRLQGFDRWEAQDTLEFRFKLGPSGFDGCSWGKGSPSVPVGWGRSVVDRAANPGSFMATDGWAGVLAYEAAHQHKGWKGVKALYDVERDAGGNPTMDVDGFRYTILVAKTKAQVPTHENLGFSARSLAGRMGSPDLKTGFAKGGMFAMAQARIFFARPVRNGRDITGGGLFRADSHQEYASLYNPYWQVRLSKPSDLTRAAVFGVAGLNPALGGFAP